MSETVYLLIFKYPDEETPIKRYPLTKDIMVIGRNSLCDIILTNRTVSRDHARIECREDRYFVTNLSAKGTLLDGLSINQETPLRLGQTLKFGAMEATFSRGAADEEEVQEANSTFTLDGVDESDFEGETITPEALEEQTNPPTLAAPDITQQEDTFREEKEKVDPDSVNPHDVGTIYLNKPEKPKALLEISTDGSETSAHWVTGSLNIGRGRENHVILDDPNVSRQHLRLVEQEDGFHATLQATNNHLYVNGEGCQEAALGDHAVIQIGKTHIVFRSEQELNQPKSTPTAAIPTPPSATQPLPIQQKSSLVKRLVPTILLLLVVAGGVAGYLLYGGLSEKEYRSTLAQANLATSNSQYDQANQLLATLLGNSSLENQQRAEVVTHSLEVAFAHAQSFWTQGQHYQGLKALQSHIDQLQSFSLGNHIQDQTIQQIQTRLLTQVEQSLGDSRLKEAKSTLDWLALNFPAKSEGTPKHQELRQQYITQVAAQSDLTTANRLIDEKSFDEAGEKLRHCLEQYDLWGKPCGKRLSALAATFYTQGKSLFEAAKKDPKNQDKLLRDALSQLHLAARYQPNEQSYTQLRQQAISYRLDSVSTPKDYSDFGLFDEAGNINFNY